MQASLDLNPGQRYRVFAHVGNGLSESGVTVTLQLLEDAFDSIVLDFWTRQDAVALFRNLALAADATTATQEDEDIPGGALMIEATTASWEEIKREDS